MACTRLPSIGLSTRPNAYGNHYLGHPGPYRVVAVEPEIPHAVRRKADRRRRAVPRPEGARNTYAVRVEELHPLARDEWSIHATGASDHRRRILSRRGEHPHQKKERAAKTHP